jgi:hypothetical protein
MKKSLLLATILISSSDVFAFEFATTVKKCTENGIAYFKDIGSYPTLTSSIYAGRSADLEAETRCKRTLTAFPNPEPFCIDYATQNRVRRDYANDPELLRTLEQIWADNESKYPKCK